MRRPSVIALIAITIVFVASTLPVNARSSGQAQSGPVTVIAVDQGAYPSRGDLDMTETALMTLAGGITEGDVAFMRYGAEVSTPVSAGAGPEAVGLAGDEMAKVTLSEGAEKSDQVGVLTRAFSYLTNLDAPGGSRVVLITPGRIAGESENTRERLRSVGDLYANEGWRIDVATMPTTAAALRDLLAELSTSSAGEYFDLGTSEGLLLLLSQALGVEPESVIDAELNGQELASTFEVAPLTSRATIAFLRPGSGTRVSLFLPNGSQVTSTLPGAEVVEAPNAVIFNLTGPAAGTWTVQAEGDLGKLITAVDLRSPLSVQLIEQPPLPVGEPGIITAAAMLDGEPQVIPGTRIQATVRQADGFTNIYQLNDEGIAGDAKAGDGIFSVRLPAPAAQGINDVSLEMRWDELDAMVKGAGSYKTEVFPEVRVTRMFDVKAHEGDEAVVATIEAFVGEFPYLASPDEFNVRLISTGGEVVGRVVPRSEPEPGKAYAFDVLAKVPASGEYSVSVTMNTDYLGRSYAAAGPGISTNATVTPQPFLVLGLPVWAWAAVIVAAVAGLVLVIIRSKQVRPYGFIYDDQDKVVVDFASLRRAWVRKLFASDRVKASEAAGLPFKGGTFHFTREGVKLEHTPLPGDPSLRVNSRPAAPVVDMSDDTWLGVSGRLLTFTRERRPKSGVVFAPADD
jgi:hypothetical protein